MDEIKALFGSSPLLSKIYDIARIVDPVGKSVIKYSENKVVTEEYKCYDFWGNNKVCDNCILMRAYNDNLTYIKMEFNKEKVYLITAVPYELDGKRVVIELLKEITDNMLFGKDEYASAEMKEIRLLIENMNKLASRDHLTGLYNRRYITEKLPVDIVSAELSAKPLALIMADIDSFKDINDNYGHSVGDLALKSFAKTLQAAVDTRKGWIARFGGDEFLICLHGTSLESAAETAEGIRKAICDKKIIADGREISMTTSLGVYLVDTKASHTLGDVLRYVDEKMYDAKRNGRNTVNF